MAYLDKLRKKTKSSLHAANKRSPPRIINTVTKKKKLASYLETPTLDHKSRINEQVLHLYPGLYKKIKGRPHVYALDSDDEATREMR